MINTSQAYKAQMRKPIRNLSYMKIGYGIFNLPATEQAQFESADQTSFSKLELKDDTLPEYSYATFEKDRMKVGSSQIILPSTGYKYQGYVSDSISDENGVFHNPPTIVITFTDPQDIYGLTLLFDPVEGTYPKKISVNGTEFNVNSAQFVTSGKLYGVQSIEIKFLETHKPFWRARLAQVQFGQSVIFDNKKIKTSTLQTKVDLVSGELSNKKLTFQVTNYDQLYNPLNPQGLTEFIDERQPVKVEYGYELDDGSIEWILGDNLVIEGTPKTGDYDVTFTAIDNLSNLTGTYYKGEFTDGGITLYDLAEKVMKDAGVEDYVIDVRLKTIKTTGALPILTHRECLQIIANAGQSILFTNREGQIQIKTALDPVITVSDNNHIFYSDTQSAYNDLDLPTVKYAEFLPNSMRVGKDNKVILPEDSSKYSRRGYISDVYCGEDGSFGEIKPTYIISYSFPYSAYSIPLVFDNIDKEYAVDFDVVYYLGADEVDRKEVRGNTEFNYNIEYDVSNMDRIEIVILKWSVPQHRAVIAQVGKGRVNDMRIDFYSSYKRPTVEKRVLSKSVTVMNYNYSAETQLSDIVKQPIIVNGTSTFQIQHEGAKNIVASVSSGSITAQKHYAYMSEITVEGEGDIDLTLQGNKIITNMIAVIKQLNPRGVEQPAIKNPLITDASIAELQALWIGDFYNKRSKLKSDYRGNPEIDAYDILYVESQFEPLFPARVSETKITFDGALRGNLTVIKI